MDQWELDFEWLKTRHFIKDSFARDSLPDLQAVLFLIGIQEACVLKKSFTKEEKQDLMHIATCHLLSQEGYFEFEGRDQDGWPHYKQIRVIPFEGVKAQEELLKENIIRYFDQYSSEPNLM